MNLVYFTLFALLLFMSVLLGGKKFRSSALYALAIGGCVNANFFNAKTYPIDIFGLTFGIDSILYTLFIFCVIVLLLDQGKKQAYILSFSSIIATMLCAIFQLVSSLLSKGYSNNVWIPFFDFAISSISSVIVVIIIIELLSFFKKRNIVNNQYLLLLIGGLIATLINSPTYYFFANLLNEIPLNTLEVISTSLIGKLISIGVSLLTLFTLNLYDNKSKKNQ